MDILFISKTMIMYDRKYSRQTIDQVMVAPTSDESDKNNYRRRRSFDPLLTVCPMVGYKHRHLTYGANCHMFILI